MSDPIRDAAIEAAVDAMVTDDNERPFFRDELPPLVDAVLAVAGPAYRAEALRDAADHFDKYDVVTIENVDIGSNMVPVDPAQRLRDRADAEEDDHV